MKTLVKPSLLILIGGLSANLAHSNVNSTSRRSNKTTLASELAYNTKRGAKKAAKKPHSKVSMKEAKGRVNTIKTGGPRKN
jgi:hypothetical protein